MKILGIGSAITDLLVRLQDDSLLGKLGLQKGGMTLIDEKQQAQICIEQAEMDVEKSPGGSARNTILALQHMGVETDFIGVKRGIANTFVTGDAERTFATYMETKPILTPADIKREMFTGYDIVHVEGYLVETPKLLTNICREAKQAGAMVSLDLASYNTVIENREFFHNLVQEFVDIVFANQREAAAYCSGNIENKVENMDLHLRQIATECKVAIVKLGSKGASAMMDGEKILLPSSPIKPVDTTAAGDFFAGGFLYALSHGMSLHDCVWWGARLGEAVIQVLGTKIPEETWKEIRQ